MKAEQGDWVSGVELYEVEFWQNLEKTQHRWWFSSPIENVGRKKRNTDDDFPPPLKMWVEKFKKRNIDDDFPPPLKMWVEKLKKRNIDDDFPPPLKMWVEKLKKNAT